MHTGARNWMNYPGGLINRRSFLRRSMGLSGNGLVEPEIALKFENKNGTRKTGNSQIHTEFRFIFSVKFHAFSEFRVPLNPFSLSDALNNIRRPIHLHFPSRLLSAQL